MGLFVWARRALNRPFRRFSARAVAFLVLCVATNNIIVSSLAVLTISSVVACVLGSM
jgi:hypothetical protein